MFEAAAEIDDVLIARTANVFMSLAQNAIIPKTALLEANTAPMAGTLN